tara:strand:+ start:3282 stop:3809 length:528 start_codon:yes stop_codon:yes gene_type:complete
MAKISNTASYPIIVPTGGDYFLLTDADNSNTTKNCTIDNLSNYLALNTINISVRVSAANLKVIGSVPYQILPAPGVGFTYKIIQATAFLDFKTTAHNFSSQANIEMDNGGAAYSAAVFPFSVLNATADTVYTSIISAGILPTNTALSLNGANSTAGDSPFIINITYHKFKLDSTF